MGKFEIWLRDTLAQAENYLAEAEAERTATCIDSYSEWNYWRGRANALNETLNTFQLMDKASYD